MRYRIILAALLGSVALVLPFAPSAQATTSAIRFGLIYYNSPGSDTGSNASLNAEYVTVKNVGTTGRYLTNWTVRDAQGHIYTFGTFHLGAGKRVRIHTGKGSNTSTDRYWGRGWYVWNNTGDKAVLRNAAGTWRDSCAWGSSGPGYTYC